MPEPIDRRFFIARLAVAPLGAALLARDLRLRGLRERGSTDLPPRVVGLRTMGGDFRFDPPGLRLEPGATLIWLNMGDFHTTSAFHPDNAELLGGEVPLRIPEGADSWHSGMLGLTAGTEFEHTFRVPGVYDYFCQPHYGFGMVGRLVVGEPRGGPGTRAMEGLPDAVRDGLPDAAAIMGVRGRGWEWASRINGTLWLRAHDRDATGPAATMEEAIHGDGELQRWLGSESERGKLARAIADFADGIRDGADYEDLVQRADAAKTLL